MSTSTPQEDRGSIDSIDRHGHLHALPGEGPHQDGGGPVHLHLVLHQASPLAPGEGADHLPAVQGGVLHGLSLHKLDGVTSEPGVCPDTPPTGGSGGARPGQRFRFTLATGGGGRPVHRDYGLG